MSRPGFSNVISFDDAPFDRRHRGDIPVVGTVFTGLRCDGILVGRVRRDGANSTARLAELVRESRFAAHPQLILLQGIALAGFNVVDLNRLQQRLGRPVLVVARHRPDLAAIHAALEKRVPGGARKWRLIKQAGPMEPLGKVFVQRAGLTLEEAREVMERLCVHGHLPEPLRLAHLVAGALVRGQSHGRA